MLLHAATRKGLFVIATEGGQDRITGRHFLGDNVTLSHVHARSGAWFAALEHGHFGPKLHRSRDQGRSWEAVATPAYPPAPPDGEKGPDGRPWPWDCKRLWAFASAAQDPQGTLWCGTIPGGLFTSSDDGASWRLVESLWHHPHRRQWFGGGADYPGIHSIAIDPRDPRCVRIGVSCGGVWRTRDGGGSWEHTSRGLFATYMPPERREDPLIQDVHCLVQCHGQPDHLWIQHHNGVFRSSDGGERWSHCPDVPPGGNGFGFAVAVHPQDGGCAWLAPAQSDERRIPLDGRVVVTRTADGAASWQVVRAGLPQDDAYDLVFRHGLVCARDGRSLAMGSTTGALWLSSDAGDQWREVNAHLPPIHGLTWVE